LETAIGYFRGGSVVKEELKNGKPAVGVTPEHRRAILEKRIVDTEAMLESLRMDVIAQEAALSALRRELGD
jgi:hypothetical protein